MSRPTAPYGAWPSTISAAALAEAGVSYVGVCADGDDVYWLEVRAREGGRAVIVRRHADGSVVDVLPEGFSARSRVHEYGGGAFAVRAGTVLFVNDDDQRLYTIVRGAEPRALTEAPSETRALRYGDLQLASDHAVCVRERHGEGEPENTLVRVSLSTGEVTEIQSGRDFYAYPRISRAGDAIAWIAWDHPHMPWDASEAWLATLRPDGALAGPRRVAGGPGESVALVAWSPAGELHVVSDRSGWWNLYRLDGAGEDLVPVAPIEAECGNPLWVFGDDNVAFTADGRIILAYQSRGSWQLGLVAPPRPTIRRLDVPYTDFGRSARVATDDADRVLCIGGSPTRRHEVARLTITADGATQAECLRAGADVPLADEHVSRPEPLTVSGPDGREVHAFYYPPQNRAVEAPAGARPPLLVMVHGGPTGSTSTVLSLGIQYWTTRGFAVADVNYSGSTGYGRAYRERLRGGWGVVDVEDCVAVARALAEGDRVDGKRLAITGGSAGGFTALAALVFHDTFTAGASSYGIGDLEALAQETHKFESRYNDFLIGPYHDARETYRARSPVHAAAGLDCPVILLQGLEDVVVPPAQAQQFVDVLQAKGLTHAYVTFPDEGHGFRKAANVVRALEAELAFFAHVFGFEPAEALPPLEIEHPRA